MSSDLQAEILIQDIGQNLISNLPIVGRKEYKSRLVAVVNHMI